MLKIEIKTGGAAYSEDDVLTTEGRYELQRNLMDICRKITNNCSCIHRTGSVKGMVKLGFWSKNTDKVRHGNWIYQQP